MHNLDSYRAFQQDKEVEKDAVKRPPSRCLFTDRLDILLFSPVLLQPSLCNDGTIEEAGEQYGDAAESRCSTAMERATVTESIEMQPRLTVMMKGTVLIISRRKDTWKICSQMFP